jgi:hypothetical protein
VNQQTLVVLHSLRDDSRETTINHALCFAQHLKGFDIQYVNIFGKIPFLNRVDLVVVTYELASLRNLPIWKILEKRMSSILKASRCRVLMPQDDYSRSDVLDAFVVDHSFDYVFTPITRDLHILYPRASAAGVKFEEAFTGYFEESDWYRVSRFAQPFSERTIDVGQRVRYLPPQLGEKAGIKGRLAIEFGELAKERGFVCDVSTKSEDVLLGDDWWRFLGNMKFTVSRRGGASMADPTGRLADRVRRYQMRHPKATMEDIASHVSMRGGREGDFSAISPRLFEAAALGVCQILEPDQYVDGLEPWTHYIPLEADFSNIAEVFTAMNDDARCEEIVQASQELLLRSGQFTYHAFVSRIAATVGLAAQPSISTTASDSSENLDLIVQGNGSNLRWIQDYVRRAYLGRKLKLAIESLESGHLLTLNSDDEKWQSVAEDMPESVIAWLDSFRSNELIVESLAIPWRTATSFTHRDTTST